MYKVLCGLLVVDTSLSLLLQLRFHHPYSIFVFPQCANTHIWIAYALLMILRRSCVLIWYHLSALHTQFGSALLASTPQLEWSRLSDGTGISVAVYAQGENLARILEAM